MKRILTASLVATLALTSVNATSIADLEAEIAKLKKKDSKLNKKINAVKAHDAGDNIKWGVDMRTSYDNINYDMADGSTAGKDNLYSYRLWLNMAYAPDANNVFKGQLSMNKAMGASFDSPMNRMYDPFDWTTNEALRDTTLRVRQAYWLYLGEKAFGLDMPWTFSIGRRPSTNGFLSNLSQDDAAASPLGHIINVEYDGLSSKLDLSKVTGIPGMSIKLCMGNGSTNAAPLIGSPTPNADVEENGLEDIQLAGFIVEPFNNGQIITKALWFKAFDLPGMQSPFNPDFDGNFHQFGNIQGGAFSALIDGITEDGYFSDAKLFGSFAFSQTDPDAGSAMLGSIDQETGTSYWFGAYLPVTDGENNYGRLGLEYNHGSEYWRPFTYAEDTMAGSKMATRGDAYEVNYTYQINEALSMQLRYVQMDYEYTGSNGFFGNYSGTPNKIDDLKDGAAAFDQLAAGGAFTGATTQEEMVGAIMGATGASQQDAMGILMAKEMLPMVVETAKDFRFYIRYRF